VSVLLRSEYSVRESTLTAVLMLVKRGSPVMLAPGGDVVEIVATRNRRAGYQQQDLLERIHDPQGSRSSVSSAKCRKSRARRARGLSPSKIGSIVALQCESERSRNHTRAVNSKLPGQGR
jgi:hypothetical protein